MSDGYNAIGVDAMIPSLSGWMGRVMMMVTWVGMWMGIDVCVLDVSVSGVAAVVHIAFWLYAVVCHVLNSAVIVPWVGWGWRNPCFCNEASGCG